MSVASKIRNRVGRLRALRWRTRRYVSDERPVVIGGSPRSGTTLLRTIIDAHPRLLCGPESSILLPGAPPFDSLRRGYGIERPELHAMLAGTGSQAEFVERFFRTVCERSGKPRWSEKTPLNVWHLDWIWDHFPEARFVHVIRDGRDVVCSMRLHPDRRWEGDIMVKVERRESLRRTVGRWVTSTGKGLRHRGDPRYRELRYEDLVTRPREVLEGLFEWLGEDFDPLVLAAWEDPDASIRHGAEWDAKGAIQTSSVGRWRRDLDEEEIAVLRRHATARLLELGYVERADW